MTTLRPASTVLALLLVAGAALPAARAQAPEAELSATEQDAVLSFLELGRPDLASAAQKDREGALRQALKLWSGLDPAVRDLLRHRFEWVAANLAEPGVAAFQSDRAIACFVLGPPSRIHSETSHSWSGETLLDLATPADVVADLTAFAQGKGSAPAGPAPGVPSGIPSFAQPVEPAAATGGEGAATLPTEIWVHEVPGDPGHVRVLWFADRDASGRFRLAKHALLESTQRISEAPAKELPADVFEQMGIGGEFEALPKVSETPVGLTVLTSRFKAAESKTFVRFVVFARSVDVEIELEKDPVEWFGEAAFWLRVEEGGQPVYQISRSRAAQEVVQQGDAWLAEFGVPLRPGTYSWTALLVGRDGRGGQATGTVEVPDLTAGLALSSVTLAAAAGGSLPQAGLASKEGDLAPFQVGSFRVVPRVDGTFHRGETIGVVVQVYNAPSATLELDLWYDGQYQSSLDPSRIKQLPATEIQLIDVTEAYPDGSYKFVLTATAPDGSKATQEAAFRVKG